MLELIFLVICSFLLYKLASAKQEIIDLSKVINDEIELPEDADECDCRACVAERKNELLTEGVDAAYELLFCSNQEQVKKIN